MATRVLVVEDEADIARLVQHTLERDGDLQVHIVERGDDALEWVANDSAALIILDLNLPVLSGFEVCRILRARPKTAHVPIIMLTARAAENDRVSGLELGADDYITKPFSPRELAARVRAVLRRAPSLAPPTPGLYRGRHLVADFDAVAISVDGRAVRLTKRELELLKCLVENRNRVLSRDRLLERVWGYDRTVETRSIDVHVGRLRSKLGPAGQQNRDPRRSGLPIRRARPGSRRRALRSRLRRPVPAPGGRRGGPLEAPGAHVAAVWGAGQKPHVHQGGQDRLAGHLIEGVEPLHLVPRQAQPRQLQILSADAPRRLGHWNHGWVTPGSSLAAGGVARVSEA